jgi:hypothetical protein
MLWLAEFFFQVLSAQCGEDSSEERNVGERTHRSSRGIFPSLASPKEIA